MNKVSKIRVLFFPYNIITKIECWPGLFSKGGFTRQSNTGDGFLKPANDGGNLQHQLMRSA